MAICIARGGTRQVALGHCHRIPSTHVDLGLLAGLRAVAAAAVAHPGHSGPRPALGPSGSGGYPGWNRFGASARSARGWEGGEWHGRADPGQRAADRSRPRPLLADRVVGAATGAPLRAVRYGGCAGTHAPAYACHLSAFPDVLLSLLASFCHLSAMGLLRIGKEHVTSPLLSPRGNAGRREMPRDSRV